MISVAFSICSFIYIIIFTIVYFSKTRINLIENKVYTWLLITTIVGLSIDIIGYFSFKNGVDSIINITIAKIYLIYYFTWIYLLTIYTYLVSMKHKHKNYKNMFSVLKIIYLLIVLIIPILPIDFNITNSSLYSRGPSVNFIYFLSFICIIIMLICLLSNLKNIKKKEYIPLFVFIIGGSIVMFIQHEYPDLLLLITAQSVVTALMYFTIENPDMQMVEELNKNRKLTEQNFEEKSNFLFKISQDLKQPLKEITTLSQEIINGNDVEENSKKINYNSKNLYTYVNSALDVSQIDIKNLKIIDSTYNAKNFFEEIKLRTQNELKNKNIELRVNITNNLPEYLSGDNTKLKQVILSVIFNSIKHTKNGFIEFNVNAIIKYGVCRLLIEISDCGGGMEIDKINNILSINEEITKNDIEKIDKLNIDLVLSHKIIKVLNGNFIIKSEEGHGTNFLIIIDQKIEEMKKNENLKKIENYSKKILNQDKVLLISDDEEIINKITKKIDVSTSLYIKDAIEKLKNKKVKCIIIDDNLKDSSAINALKELNTSIPCIILIDNREKFLSSHYIEDGFKDFMLKEYIEDEISKIDKYL